MPRHPTSGKFGLTERQMELVALVANGYTNREIAQIMVVQLNSVKALLSVVMEKMGARNRVEVAATWIREVELARDEDVAA